MSEVEILEYFEIDLTRCANTYGSTPCTAEVGVTGDFKCYNCPATCQDPANYVADERKTFRFAVPSAALPVSIDARPNIENIKVRPQEIKPAEALGTRESGTVTFQNHRDNDSGYDLYLSDRSSNPYELGTHWGKFSARWPNLQGYPCRVIRGELGQTIGEMETRHYFAEESSGPSIDGKFSITFKDALKFLDGKKAQAPLPSTGRLNADITDTATSLTLVPAGVGDSEYPASGYASIGDEYVSFTRSSDTITLTGRGLRGSEQDEHDADETFQLALVYSSKDPAFIIDDLIFGTNDAGTRYTETPTEYQNYSSWLEETETFYGRLLSADIAKPTSVRDLVSELIQQVGLMIYTDVVNKLIRLKVLRANAAVLSINDDNHIAGSLKFMRDEERRTNAVFTYFGQRNPLEKLDEDANYNSISVLYDDDQVKALENLPLSIRTIKSRWITTLNRPAANDINQAIIDRYGDTPGVCSFRLPFTKTVNVGSTISIKSSLFEDAQGAERSAQTAVITSLKRSEARFDVKALLFNFRKAESSASGDRAILIDEDIEDVNLREIHDLIYTEPDGSEVVVVTVSSTAIVSSSGTGTPAFDVGDWPAGVDISITVDGDIVGRGGAGGSGGVSADGGDGADGGTAFYTRFAVSITNNGVIGAGGGGGGGGAGITDDFGSGAGGGGGGGYGTGGVSTDSAISGDDGGPILGGSGGAGASGGDGGNGGDLAQSGASGESTTDFDGGAAGSPGNAVDGDSYITWDVLGDVRGSQVN